MIDYFKMKILRSEKERGKASKGKNRARRGRGIERGEKMRKQTQTIEIFSRTNLKWLRSKFITV